MTAAPPDDEDDRLLTSYEAGALLDVDPSTINKWTNQGRLTAFRTPGGHRRISASDLVQFLHARKRPIPARLSAAARRRVLLVDDDPKQLQALRRALRPHQARIEVATSQHGIDALVQVGAFRPHVILLDLFMPELDGLEVCRRLKAHPATAAIDVLVASGQLTPALERSALAAGARRCLAKPLDLPEVVDAIGIPEAAAV